MDWVSVGYVTEKGKNRRTGDSSTADAEAAIIRGADKYANGGQRSKFEFRPCLHDEIQFRLRRYRQPQRSLTT